MSNEISHRADATGGTLYYTIRNTSRQYWDTDTDKPPAFATLTVAGWYNASTTAANHWIALAETPASSYFFVGDWPATLTTVGWYFVDIYNRVGATPAISDTLIGTQYGYWDGANYNLNAGADTAGTTTMLANYSTFNPTASTDMRLKSLHIISDDDHAFLCQTSAVDKHGLYTNSTAVTGAGCGQKNSGHAFGLYNSATQATGAGQFNFSSSGYGCVNTGGTTDIYLGGTGTIQETTGNVIQIGAAAALTAFGKTGYSLAATGLDSITATRPTGKATTFPAMLVQLFYRFFGKVDKDTTTNMIKTYAANGTTVVTTQTIAETTTSETQGEAT